MQADIVFPKVFPYANIWINFISELNRKEKIYLKCLTLIYILTQFIGPSDRGGGAVGKSVRPASGTSDVRSPAVTDLSRKNR